MPEQEQLEFIDTHVHFFDFSQPDLRWVWLEPEFVHPVVGNIDGMKSQRYTAWEFVAESRFHNVQRCVHVQAALGTEDPVNETKWLQAMADEQGMPQALVADAPLQHPDVGEVLARHAEYPNMRGIRDFAEGDYLVDPDFERGYRQLAEHGWVYDLDTEWEHFHKAAALAGRHPDTTMIVDHAGFPKSRDDDYFANWRDALRELAKVENVVIKISGLGMCDQRWTLESLRPWVHECLESFGTERAIFGTNWPLDRLYSGYGDIVQAYRTLISDLSIEEQRRVLSENAAALFRI
jgi:predicted TIM-barrel fold metal-dependent hydrolase